MNELEFYDAGQGALVSRDARRGSRTISRYQIGGQVRVAKIDTDTDVAMAKADALTTATGSAMACVVRVAQAQRQFEQLAPEAAGRLAFLADDHMLGLSEIVSALRCDLRRK
jgi:hypothetical protein